MSNRWRPPTTEELATISDQDLQYLWQGVGAELANRIAAALQQLLFMAKDHACKDFCKMNDTSQEGNVDYPKCSLKETS